MFYHKLDRNVRFQLTKSSLERNSNSDKVTEKENAPLTGLGSNSGLI